MATQTISEREDVVCKKPRVKYTNNQVAMLERLFEEQRYPDTDTQEQLAAKVGVSLERVAIWFQNRRAKFKRQSQADHIAWMRKQIFQNETEHAHNLPFGTPVLPILTSACHVLSPLDSQIGRGDMATETMANCSTPIGPHCRQKTTWNTSGAHAQPQFIQPHASHTPARHHPYNRSRKRFSRSPKLQRVLSNHTTAVSVATPASKNYSPIGQRLLIAPPVSERRTSICHSVSTATRSSENCPSIGQPVTPSLTPCARTGQYAFADTHPHNSTEYHHCQYQPMAPPIEPSFCRHAGEIIPERPHSTTSASPVVRIPLVPFDLNASSHWNSLPERTDASRYSPYRHYEITS